MSHRARRLHDMYTLGMGVGVQCVRVCTWCCVRAAGLPASGSGLARGPAEARDGKAAHAPLAGSPTTSDLLSTPRPSPQRRLLLWLSAVTRAAPARAPRALLAPRARPPAPGWPTAPALLVFVLFVPPEQPSLIHSDSAHPKRRLQHARACTWRRPAPRTRRAPAGSPRHFAFTRHGAGRAPARPGARKRAPAPQPAPAP